MEYFICDKCGEVLSEEEVPFHIEDFGFETGIGWKSMNQEIADNCSCGGEFVIAEKRSLCGNWCNPDLLDNNSICKNCLENELTFENAIEVGDKEKTQIEINGYLAYEFDELQIEDILKQELEESKRFVKLKYRDYLRDNL